MKNILKISSIIAVLLFSATSCTNEDDAVATPIDRPVLLTPATGTTLTLNPGMDDNLAVALVWDDANYGVNTVPNYTIQIALAGTDFAAPIDAGTTTNRFYSWTIGELNGAMLALGATPYEETNIDVRIKSSVGD